MGGKKKKGQNRGRSNTVSVAGESLCDDLLFALTSPSAGRQQEEEEKEGGKGKNGGAESRSLDAVRGGKLNPA